MAEVAPQSSGNIWSDLVRSFRRGDPVSKETEEILAQVGLTRARKQLQDAQSGLEKTQKTPQQQLQEQMAVREANAQQGLKETSGVLSNVIGAPTVLDAGDRVSDRKLREEERLAALRRGDRSADVENALRLLDPQRKHEREYGAQVQAGTMETLDKLIAARDADQAFYERMTRPKPVEQLFRGLAESVTALAPLLAGKALNIL